MKVRSYLALMITAAVAIVLITINLVSGADDAPETSSLPHFQTAPEVRVRITSEPQVSRGQDPVLVQLVDGTLPQEAENITVLTDENCQPDGEGVSHCLNRIRFDTAGGMGETTLQHHHNMGEEPCLAPGEMLVVVQ